MGFFSLRFLLYTQFPIQNLICIIKSKQIEISYYRSCYNYSPDCQNRRWVERSRRLDATPQDLLVADGTLDPQLDRLRYVINLHLESAKLWQRNLLSLTRWHYRCVGTRQYLEQVPYGHQPKDDQLQFVQPEKIRVVVSNLI